MSLKYHLPSPRWHKVRFLITTSFLACFCSRRGRDLREYWHNCWGKTRRSHGHQAKKWRQKLALFVRNLTYLGGFRWRNRNQNHQNMNLTYLGEFCLEKYDAPSILFPVFNPPYPQGIKKSWYCKPYGLGPLTANLQISFHHLFSYMTFWNYIYFTWKFQNYSSQMMVTGLEVIIWPPENDPSDRLC